ncbi:hypothetical protein JCM21900_000049 [Sporobolomyces salmonicolor]
MEHPALRSQLLRPRPLHLKRHPTSPISRPDLASFELTSVPPLVRAVTASPVESGKRTQAAEKREDERGRTELEVFATSGVQEDADAESSGGSESPLVAAPPDPRVSSLSLSTTPTHPAARSSSSRPATAFPTRPSQLPSPLPPSPAPAPYRASPFLSTPLTDDDGANGNSDLSLSPCWSPEFLSLRQGGGGGPARPPLKISYDVPEEREAWSAPRVHAGGTARAWAGLDGGRELPEGRDGGRGAWDFERIFARRRAPSSEGGTGVLVEGEERGRRPGADVRRRKVAALRRLQAVGAQLSWGRLADREA